MNITQDARDAAQNLWTKMFMRTSNVPNWLLSGIAAAEARGFKRAREMAAKVADDYSIAPYDDRYSVQASIAAAIRAMED